MTSENPIIIIDDDTIERPPYTGIEQWALMRQAAAKGAATTTTPNSAIGLPQLSLALEPSSSQNLRGKTASSYLHVPVIPTHPSAPTTWHVPAQPVCKGGERPTPVCGRYSTSLRNPPKKPRTNDTGPYRCPRCLYGYSRMGSVRSHFPRCVALNGNPDCDSWTDHVSCVGRRRGPIYLVPIGPAELMIRTVMHPKWIFSLLQPPSGTEMPRVETKKEQDQVLKKFAKDLKEDIRDGQQIYPEAEGLIQLLKEEEEGLWDSDSADEA